MPATFAHPVFALPAQRWGLPPSALVAGAMAPDVAYLFLPYWRPWTGHTVLGIHTFALPVGLLLLCLFHGLAEPAVVDLFPRGVRSRVGPYVGRFRWGPAGRTARIVAAVWLAAVTHVFVDWMTHADGRIATALPQVFIAPTLAGLPVCKWLQYGGSVVGTAVLAGWAYRWLRAAPEGPTYPRRHLPVSWWMVLVAVGVVATVWAVKNARGTQGQYLHHFAVQGAASGLVVAAALVLLLGLVHRLILAPRRL